MRTLIGLVAIACLLIVAACGKSGPCSGGGMAVDERELPANWKAVMTVPDGAVACHIADGHMDSEYGRHFELGDSPQAAFDAFRKALTATGWKKTREDLADELSLAWDGEKDGALLEVEVSRRVEDKGWVTLNFKPAPAPGKK